MNRAKLATMVVALATVTVGAFTYTVYQPKRQLGAADFADAGIAGPSHCATTPVRISPDCIAWAVARGVNVQAYERADMPIFLNVLPDAGREVLLPPGIPLSTYLGRYCVELLELGDTTLATCASSPTCCALWGANIPMRVNRTGSHCARRNIGAGFPNCFTSDGGDPGDMNVYNTTRLSGTCEIVGLPNSNGTCWVWSGDDVP